MSARSRLIDDASQWKPEDHICGPFALRHAVAAFGRFHDVDDLAAVAGTTRKDGTGPEGLALAARRCRCRLEVFERPVFASARAELLRSLRRGRPCLLLVHDMGHWVAVTGARGGRYVVFDSISGKPVSVWDEPTLRKLWRSTHEETGCRVYEGYSVVPSFAPARQARWTPADAQVAAASGRWDFDRPVAVLTRNAAPAAVPGSVSLAEVIRRAARDLPPGTAGTLRMLARVYGLRVRRGREAAAIAGIVNGLARIGGFRPPRT
ncbi:MAG: hypothetical protein FJ087_15245 [Deltaproteobacteria bacterium]|nr:hypothetical protein [Deltaproteobacteria bacterium]